MSNCAVLRCRQPAAKIIASGDGRNCWGICLLHNNEISSGKRWGVLEDGCQLLLAQVTLSRPQ